MKRAMTPVKHTALARIEAKLARLSDWNQTI
jgi:hypothetical protein